MANLTIFPIQYHPSGGNRRNTYNSEQQQQHLPAHLMNTSTSANNAMNEIIQPTLKLPERLPEGVQFMICGCDNRVRRHGQPKLSRLRAV